MRFVRQGSPRLGHGGIGIHGLFAVLPSLEFPKAGIARLGFCSSCSARVLPGIREGLFRFRKDCGGLVPPGRCWFSGSGSCLGTSGKEEGFLTRWALTEKACSHRRGSTCHGHGHGNRASFQIAAGGPVERKLVLFLGSCALQAGCFQSGVVSGNFVSVSFKWGRVGILFNFAGIRGSFLCVSRPCEKKRELCIKDP